MIKIRKGNYADIDSITAIYDAIHDEIEQGRYEMRWFRDLYPTREWACERVASADLYVMTDSEWGEEIVASAVINHNPLPEYKAGRWFQPDSYDRILILHTLVVNPVHMHKGYATAFVEYFEQLGRDSGCDRVRLDTQAIDIPARRLYHKLGYVEADRVGCEFKGIAGIDLVLIEKML